MRTREIEASQILECVICDRRYSDQDVADLRYFPRTRVCYLCYFRLQQAPYSESCFGKKTRSDHLGYDLLCIECKSLCPDRSICPKFLSGEIQMKYELTEENRRSALRLLYKEQFKKTRGRFLFQERSAIFKAFEMCRKGCSMSQLNVAMHKIGAEPKRILRIFRREVLRGYRWQWIESDRGLRLIYPDPRESKKTVQQR